MAPLKVGMADAMRAALQLSSPRSKPLCHREALSDKIRSRIAAINEQLDQEATSEQGPGHLPMLLRHLQNPSVTEEFATIMKFANTEWQTLLNWRDCAAHKTRLSKMDLNDPRQAFLDMADKLVHLPCDDHEVDLFGKERPRQAIDPELLDPNLEVRLDSRYLSQLHTEHCNENVLADTNLRSLAPSSPGHRLSPYPVPSSVPTTPSVSPKPGSAQEQIQAARHLQNSRQQLFDGHMPRLAPRNSDAAAVYNGHATPYAGNQHDVQQPSGMVDGGDRPTMASECPNQNGNIQAVSPQIVLSQVVTSQVVPSQTGQPLPQAHQQPHNCGTPTPSRQDSTSLASNGLNTGVAMSAPYPDPSQARHQSRNGNIDPYSEFAAELNRLNNEALSNRYSPADYSSPLARQWNPSVAEERARGFAVEHQARLRRTMVENGGNNSANSSANLANHHVNQHLSVPGPIRSKNSNGSVKRLQGNGTRAPMRATPPDPQPRSHLVSKQQEQTDYEQAAAQWQTWQKEQAMEVHMVKERKEKLKRELEAEMKVPDTDILAYRYRDYMEIHPLRSGERLSPYHLGLLANQTLESRSRDETMAIRYAKQKWWNYWTVKDKQMVIEMLRKKPQVVENMMEKHMKSGGYLVNGADIDNIRKTATFTIPESDIVDGDVSEDLEAPQL